MLTERLRSRAGNGYGGSRAELAQVLDDLAEVEPLLRRSADLVLTATAPTSDLADRLLATVAGSRSTRGGDRAG